MQFAEFSPSEFALAARGGMFGFTVLQDDEAASWRRDRDDQERRRLGRRGRIARDPWERSAAPCTGNRQGGAKIGSEPIGHSPTSGRQVPRVHKEIDRTAGVCY
jgi:hypothetical protein